MGVEIDREQDEIGQIRREPGVVENVIVPGIVEPQSFELLKGWVLAANPVDEADVVLDVAGLIEVPDAKLVFLAVEVLFAAGYRRALADLEAVVHAP